jgi:hypothetical protein
LKEEMTGKKTLKNDQIRLKILYDEILDRMLDTVVKYDDAQIVASTMVALSFRLYKTILSENEFKDMLKTVVKNAKKIEPFMVRRLH